MPLVPPATFNVAAVGVFEFQPVLVVTSKDMRQPVTLKGQLTIPPVTALPTMLTKIRSVLPLLNSVIGEQSTSAVAIVGPGTGLPSTPAVTGIRHIAVFPPLVLQTYMLPVPFDEE